MKQEPSEFTNRIRFKDEFIETRRYSNFKNASSLNSKELSPASLESIQITDELDGDFFTFIDRDPPTYQIKERLYLADQLI